MGGDAISFVREIEHLDFVGAVERLAAKAGITLRYDDAAVTEDRQRRDRLVEATTAAVDFYHRLLLDDARGRAPPAATSAAAASTGTSPGRSRIGWAPDRSTRCRCTSSRQKFSRQDLLDAGLAFVNRVNKLQDFFRARVHVPDLRRPGRPRGLRRPGPRERAQVQELAGVGRSTRRAGCSTA